MNSMTVSILGCGWLGLPLAKDLVNDYQVKGSTTNEQKIKILQSDGIQPFIIEVSQESVKGDVQAFLDTDLLFMNIPPQRKESNVEQAYPNKIEQIISNLNSRTQKIVFISSTSVYNDINGDVDEGINEEPEKKSGRAILKAEEIIQSSGKDWIILRMAGLIGPNRDPSKWFAGKSDIPNGLAPVNLVHLDDCIEISKQIISSDVKNQIFNVCADSHPTKKDYYTSQTKRLGLELPQFKEEVNHFKVVSNQKIKEQLGYQFIHTNLMALNSKSFVT